MPYRGAAAGIQDMMAGQIDLACVEASNIMAHLHGGKIKAYAVLDKTRWSVAPEVPTIDEAGAPGFYMTFWHGLWVPGGTPPDVIAKLNAAAVDALADPQVRQRLAQAGQDIVPREQQTPRGLGRASEGRDREVVADHQGGGHQGGVTGACTERPRHDRQLRESRRGISRPLMTNAPARLVKSPARSSAFNSRATVSRRVPTRPASSACCGTGDTTVRSLIDWIGPRSPYQLCIRFDV